MPANDSPSHWSRTKPWQHLCLLLSWHLRASSSPSGSSGCRQPRTTSARGSGPSRHHLHPAPVATHAHNNLHCTWHGSLSGRCDHNMVQSCSVPAHHSQSKTFGSLNSDKALSPDAILLPSSTCPPQPQPVPAGLPVPRALAPCCSPQQVYIILFFTYRKTLTFYFTLLPQLCIWYFLMNGSFSP